MIILSADILLKQAAKFTLKIMTLMAVSKKVLGFTKLLKKMAKDVVLLWVI